METGRGHGQQGNFDTRVGDGYYFTLMSRLPESLDPWCAADQQKRLEGCLSLADLPRLVGLVANPEGSVVYSLEFFRDSQRRPCVRGQVTTSLLVCCQRCLDPVAIEVHAQSLLAVVESDAEAELLAEEYDPLLVRDARMLPLELVEEEILLALPQVPMHAPGACDPRVISLLGDNQSVSKEQHPFGLLAQLKNRAH